MGRDLDVPQHVLRFWESKFSQIKPLKRGGGRRYYRPEDVAVLRRIRELLYSDGYTIKGVQKLFREAGLKSVLEGSDSDNTGQDAAIVSAEIGAGGNLSAAARAELEGILAELVDLRRILNSN
ncbi:MAG: MerR family transcriptional regulator [Alphaproteobacteria bacterium]